MLVVFSPMVLSQCQDLKIILSTLSWPLPEFHPDVPGFVLMSVVCITTEDSVDVQGLGYQLRPHWCSRAILI